MQDRNSATSRATGDASPTTPRSAHHGDGLIMVTGPSGSSCHTQSQLAEVKAGVLALTVREVGAESRSLGGSRRRARRRATTSSDVVAGASLTGALAISRCWHCGH
eukprot:357930-Chlamydomonas_euryale.AAC.2